MTLRTGRMYVAGALAAIAMAAALGNGWRYLGDDATRGVLAAAARAGAVSADACACACPRNTRNNFTAHTK